MSSNEGQSAGHQRVSSSRAIREPFPDESSYARDTRIPGFSKFRAIIIDKEATLTFLEIAGLLEPAWFPMIHKFAAINMNCERVSLSDRRKMQADLSSNG